jgi:hypothetical protein
VRSATVRNIAIIAALAAAVAFLPHGHATADFVGKALSILFTIMVVLFGAWFYRTYRTDIYALGDRDRGLLYGSIGIGIFAMAARPSLFDTGLGTLAWFALILSGSLGLYTVWRHYREYRI